MDFRYGTAFAVPPPEAYERLLLDVMLGDPTLYTRTDAVESAWRFCGAILDAWGSPTPPSPPLRRRIVGPRGRRRPDKAPSHTGGGSDRVFEVSIGRRGPLIIKVPSGSSASEPAVASDRRVEISRGEPEMSDTQASTYDEVSYGGNCFFYTHPDALATIATLFGIHPPPVNAAGSSNWAAPTARTSSRWRWACRRPGSWGSTSRPGRSRRAARRSRRWACATSCWSP